ncbi:MAG: hypothetical protein ACI9TY_000931 [Alphaproteobacteria bacterium]|jgi:uncharacterized protein (DUF924 family)
MNKLNDVLDFWFSDDVRAKWWLKSDAFDAEITAKFSALHSEILSNDISTYLLSACDALAAIIVLDQFSRNMFRDTPMSFASDALCLNMAKQAIDKGFDKELSDEQVALMYMPFMHSENLVDHEIALKLFASREALQYNLNFEKQHKVIIDQFGRYPHRNAILGRVSTTEELEFLKQPGSSF